jgi:hypothetical protein
MKHGDLQFSRDVLSVDLWYPNVPDDPNVPRTFDHPKVVEVGLMHVRAADSIRIEYDFDRNGYTIKQASRFQWEADDAACDSDWQEVAFVQAWAREIDPDSGNEEAQSLLNQLDVAHANAEAAVRTMPPSTAPLTGSLKVLVDIARGQLQAAVNHIEQAWKELTESTKRGS